MNTKFKEKSTGELANYAQTLLRELESDSVDKQGRLTVTMIMFTLVCEECNLTKASYLFLCEQIAEHGKWR